MYVYLYFVILIILFLICIEYLINIKHKKKLPPNLVSFHVHIQKMKFTKDIARINVGDTIEFINSDIIRHTVISDSPYVRNSGIIKPKQKFFCTFWKKGEYYLYSSLYNEIKPIRVIVE